MRRIVPLCIAVIPTLIPILIPMLTPILIPSLAWATPAQEDIRTWLASPQKKPPFASRLKELRSPSLEQRDKAKSYLRELLTELGQLEREGKSPLTPTPFFNGPVLVESRELRQAMVSHMVAEASNDEAIELLGQVIKTDPDFECQASASLALEKVRTPASLQLARQLIAQPHPNKVVLTKALKKIEKERAASTVPELSALGHHHRRNIRELAIRLGAPPESPSLPKPVIDDLGSVCQAVIVSVPASARWVRVSCPNGVLLSALGVFQHRDLKTVDGYLLEQKNGRLHLVDWWGTERWLEAEKCRVQDISFEQSVAALQATRQVQSQQPFGTDTDTFFQPSWLSPPEAVLCGWMLSKGRPDLATKLLLPRLEDSSDDREMLRVTHFTLGHRYHQQMLDAFCRERDYPKAAALGRHLATLQYFGYSQRSLDLAQQLEARQDDFHQRTLPTLEEWPKLSASMDRPARLRFLLDRLRLLHCPQMGQPGGIEPDWGHSLNGKPVINPWTTLCQMKLTPQDRAVLEPYLKDQSYVLGYSFHRDFHTGRHLHRVGEFVQILVGKLK